MSQSHPVLTATIRHTRGQAVVELPPIRVHAKTADGVETRCAVSLSSIVVGSAPECDLVVEDAAVSRRHLELVLDPAGLRLKDLGSKNGTWLNGTRVFDALLPLAQPVAIGGSQLWLEASGNSQEVPLSAEPFFGEAWGNSPVMRALFAALARAAPMDVPVLLLGETGTGKELLARALHQASPRAQEPFVVLDCAAMSPSLVESELFGHVRGAFSGAETARRGLLEEASGGTLFIDELGELPVELQPRLLRVLETKKVRALGSTADRGVDVRIVAATHRDLAEQLRTGEFREDLYFRVAVVELHVPPLRQHKEDIPELVGRALAALDPPLTLQDLPPRALAMFAAHDWPGNVRELNNAVLRLALNPAGAVSDQNLRALARGHRALAPLAVAREKAVGEFEARYLREAIDAADGNMTEAARLLAISRQQLYRLLARHGLRPRDP